MAKPIKKPLNKNPFVLAKPIPVKYPLHPIDKEIIRSLVSTRIRTTPSYIARAIGIHPLTAKNRIQTLHEKGLVQCKPKGNRTYCKVDIKDLKRRLKRDFYFS